MKVKKLLAGMLSAAMVLGTMVMPAFADDSTTTEMTFAEFLNNAGSDDDVEFNGETYAGTGNRLKVTLKPQSVCEFGDCVDGVPAVEPSDANPKKLDSGMAQYQIFAAKSNVKISNVEFVYESTEFCIHTNSGWTTYPDSVKPENGQIQVLNTADVEFDNCGFNGVNLNFWRSDGAGKTVQVTKCNFNDITDGAGIKWIGTENAVVTNNTFTDCKAGVMFAPKNGKPNLTVESNSFNKIKEEVVQLAGEADYTDATNIKIVDNVIENPTENTYMFRIKNNNAKVTEFNNNTGVDSIPMTSDTADSMKFVAQIGNKLYATIADAVAAAQNGDTVTLLADVTESITIANGKNITLDLNGKTLTNTENANTITNYGNLTITDSSSEKTGTVDNVSNGKQPLTNFEGGEVTINGGKFYRSLENGVVGNNSNSSYTIKNWGVMTINNGEIIGYAGDNHNGSSTIGNGYYNGSTFDNHTVTTPNVKLTINGGTITNGKWTVKNDDYGNIEINGGTVVNTGTAGGVIFNGNYAKITGGSFKAAAKNAVVLGGAKYSSSGCNAGDTTITGGDFFGGIRNSLFGEEADTKISGGTFSTDVTAYCVPGYSAKLVDGKYVVDNITNKITLKFEPTSDKKVYNIVLSGGKENINRLSTADFTFDFTTTGKMSYAVAEKDGVNLTNPSENRYAFNFNGKDAADETGKEITLGTVTFDGYGTFSFGVKDVNTNIVHAAKSTDNIVEEFVVGGGTGKGTLDVSAELTDVELTVPTNKLTINVTFPNAVADNAKAYQDMKVTIVGGETNETVNLGKDEQAMENGEYSFTKELPENTPYTVTVSGAGYRTARYTVTLSGDKTLNFWNNAKDNAVEVEVGNTNSKKAVTFLAGDIVKDNEINIYDLSAVVSYFGTDNLVENHKEYAKYDLNRDGKIDSKDVAYVLVSWGK